MEAQREVGPLISAFTELLNAELVFLALTALVRQKDNSDTCFSDTCAPPLCSPRASLCKTEL